MLYKKLKSKLKQNSNIVTRKINTNLLSLIWKNKREKNLSIRSKQRGCSNESRTGKFGKNKPLSSTRWHKGFHQRLSMLCSNLKLHSHRRESLRQTLCGWTLSNRENSHYSKNEKMSSNVNGNCKFCKGIPMNLSTKYSRFRRKCQP